MLACMSACVPACAPLLCVLEFLFFVENPAANLHVSLCAFVSVALRIVVDVNAKALCIKWTWLRNHNGDIRGVLG